MRVAAIMVSFALFLSACSAPGGTAAGDAPPAAPAAPTASQNTADALADTAWVLVSIDGAEVPPDPVIRLELKGGAANGFAGCNFFESGYSADAATLRFQQVLQSAMLCEDEALMRQESSFLDALRSIDTYTLQGETLELRDASGVARLVFRAR